MTTELIQALASLVHDLVDLAPERSAIAKRAHEALGEAERFLSPAPNDQPCQYVLLNCRMAMDIAAMAKARPFSTLILAVPMRETAEPLTIEVFVATDLDPEPIGMVMP